MGELFGIPVKDLSHGDGRRRQEHALPRDRFYIPGSLMRASVDNTNPVAFGMEDSADVFFDSSPVSAWSQPPRLKRTSAIAWYAGTDLLDSGWAGATVPGRRHRGGGSLRR